MGGVELGEKEQEAIRLEDVRRYFVLASSKMLLANQDPQYSTSSKWSTRCISVCINFRAGVYFYFTLFCSNFFGSKEHEFFACYERLDQFVDCGLPWLRFDLSCGTREHGGRGCKVGQLCKKQVCSRLWRITFRFDSL